MDVDDDDDDENPLLCPEIVVTRSVHDAGMALIALEKAGQTDGQKSFFVAEARAEERAAAGDRAGEKFWRDVYSFAFQWDVLLEKDTKLTIIEDGQEGRGTLN